MIFYLHSTGLCGGIRVVLEMVSRLNDAGVDCELWTPPAPVPKWFKRKLRLRQFNSLAALGDAARATRAHKVATWWETAYWVKETIKEDDRGYYLTQDIETTYSNSDEQSRRIVGTYKMGLIPIPTSRWVEKELSWNHVCKSDVAPRFVGLGIDLDTFMPLPMAREQYRIFCPYRPGAGPRDLKGWLCARMAAVECQSIVPETSLVTFGQGPGPGDVPAGIPHIHMNSVNDGKLRELYSQAGVFLMPSNHEGFGLTALEAMACGCPVVMTKCNGNMEYAKHSVNCLLADPGDSGLLGRHCAGIMTFPTYGHALATEGLKTALGYNWGFCIKRLKDALLS